MASEIIAALSIAIATGFVSSVSTVLALRVHVLYLREGVERNALAISRAHERIDCLEKRVK